jgi:hypothetical protein
MPRGGGRSNREPSNFSGYLIVAGIISRVHGEGRRS